MSLLDRMLGRDKESVRAYRETERRASRVYHKGLRNVPKNQRGIKRWYMLGPLDTTVKTPYGAKESRRRKALRKVAKQSRKVNRGLRPTGGRRG